MKAYSINRITVTQLLRATEDIFTVVFLAFLIMGCGVISVFGEQYKAGEYRARRLFYTIS